MAETRGLLIIDLQYGFSPDPDLVESVRDVATNYPVVVATRFAPPPDQNPVTIQVAADGVIDVGHDLIIERPGYGLNAPAIDALQSFSEITEWDLVGSRTGVCLLACAFSLSDASIPFHIVRPFRILEPEPVCEAVDQILQQHFNV
ncbi:hypothetical protein H7F10_15950 [Acidithiobacillus sp. HP-6]|uniref:hypothetical protein n=1 Tax=unclassified Acidithiobacillus TaxID=2614800 RepID=UPI00187989B7|nr:MULTISPECIES: hypothetical protein [unclassified Acidithiobacillus]MBE7564383.1 hypothetical protein [Acidithiobacillus sp. HP-6]MBE7569744.1 hypothetical protein [Acidithiobacillus sp. HP-2]